VVLALGLVACLPRERPGGEAKRDAPSTAKARQGVTPTPGAARDGSATAVDPMLTAPYHADFSASALGPEWRPVVSGVWRVAGGQLCGRGAHNRGIWLARRLPRNVRVEFTAVSHSPDGDLKAEIFGDGRSGARKVTYDDASSYLVIFGGWRNQLHVLARLNEHGADRRALAVSADAATPRALPVQPNRPYRFVVERRDGKALRWWVDGAELLTFDDPQPLVGPGHEHFGFNDWEAEVCFDDLTLTPLP